MEKKVSHHRQIPVYTPLKLIWREFRKCTQVTIFQISIQFQICQKPIPFYVAIIILLPQLYSLYISYLKSRRRLLKHSRISWIWVGLKEKEPRKILRIKLAESVTSLIIYIVKRFAHKSIFIWYLELVKRLDQFGWIL